MPENPANWAAKRLIRHTCPDTYCDVCAQRVMIRWNTRKKVWQGVGGTKEEP